MKHYHSLIVGLIFGSVWIRVFQGKAPPECGLLAIGLATVWIKAMDTKRK